jgi:hypothetical protein
MMANMNMMTEKLMAAVERLNSHLESATAPLTMVMTTGTNSQGASTSLSSETTLELMAQATMKALKEACLPGGCLHPNVVERGRADARMEHLREKELMQLLSVIQDTVDHSIYNSMPNFKEEVRNELRDSSAALRKLITAPAREFHGEMAMAVDTVLSPKFDTMSTLIKRVAILAETATSFPPGSALGDSVSETTPVYKLLSSILMAVRENQYQMSKGYDLVNSMYQDIQTTIARECRKDGEREAEIRG